MPNPTQSPLLPEDDVAAIDELRQVYQRLNEELGKIIVGQQEVIEQLAICIFARGHALLIGVPGLAKTLLISRLAETLSLSFSRIQFTPDLMPMDITGTDILQELPGGKRAFEFAKGPVFANVVLADEINRAPSKTQAAMLEAMQEHRVTIAGRTYTLEAPFFVLATQNPIEQEGTYPLPEAQLDRFMFMIGVDYPSRDGGNRHRPQHHRHDLATPQPCHRRRPPHRVPGPRAPRSGAGSPLRIRRRSRPPHPSRHRGIPGWLKPLVSWGAGPARRAISHPRRQGPRRPPRQLRRAPRGHRRRGRSCHAPSPRYHLHGADRGRHQPRADQASPRRIEQGRLANWRVRKIRKIRVSSFFPVS